MTLLKQQQHAEVTLCARLKLETNQRSSVPVLWRRLCKNPAFAKWLIHYFFLKPLLTFTSWEHRVIAQLMEGTVFHFDAAAHSGVFAAIIVTVCSLLFTKWEIYHSYQKWTMAIFSWNSFAGTLNGTGLSLLSLIPPMLLPDLKRICLLWQKLIISLFPYLLFFVVPFRKFQVQMCEALTQFAGSSCTLSIHYPLALFFLQLYVYHVVVCSEMKYRNCKFNTSHGHEGLYDL